MKKKVKRILVVVASVATGGLLVCGIYKLREMGACRYNVKSGRFEGRKPTSREAELIGTGAYVMAKMTMQMLDDGNEPSIPECFKESKEANITMGSN